MPKIKLTGALRDEYQNLFDTCQVRPPKAAAVEKITDSLIATQSRYESVSKPLGIPWVLLAAIHTMECSQNFRLHLHNGDPLSARTTHVPSGRPISGAAPFTWETSATDALQLRGLDRWDDWSIPGILYSLEGYNGWGYRTYHPEVKSPYLWSGSNHYVSGKYVADGTWSDSAVSAQLGAATLIRRLAEKGILAADSPILDSNATKTIQATTASLPPFIYAPNKNTPQGIVLQQFFNRFPGIFLKEDGKLGDKISEACKDLFGFYLQGDPRAPL